MGLSLLSGAWLLAAQAGLLAYCEFQQALEEDLETARVALEFIFAMTPDEAYEVAIVALGPCALWLPFWVFTAILARRALWLLGRALWQVRPIRRRI